MKIEFDYLMEEAKKYGDDMVNFVLTVRLHKLFEEQQIKDKNTKEMIINDFKKYPHINHYVKPFAVGGYGYNRQGELFKIIKKYIPKNEECGYTDKDGVYRHTDRKRSTHYLIQFMDNHKFTVMIKENQLINIYSDMISLCDTFELKYFNQLKNYICDKKFLSGFCSTDNPFHILTDDGHFIGYNEMYGIPQKSGYNLKHYNEFINQTDVLDFSKYLLNLSSENIVHTVWSHRHLIKRGDK